MMKKSHSKGIIIFDTLFSIVPIVLIFIVVMEYIYLFLPTEDGKYDKLLSVSDYTVKIGAVFSSAKVRYPNWVDPSKIDSEYSDEMSKRMGIPIDISFEKGKGTCIYRIVAKGEEKIPAKLYFCG